MINANIISVLMSGRGSGGSGGSSVFSIIAYYHNISNKFVDVYFNRGVYFESGAITTSNLSLSFTAGGASGLSIASVKKPDHHVSGSATNLAGGESVVRVFLTVTGTPDSTEFYSISGVNITDEGSNTLSGSTGNISLNVNPFNLWDAEEPTTVTVTGLGISTLTDLMGNVNVVQTTDADRPPYRLERKAQFVSSEWLESSGTNANYEKQQGDNFSIVVKNLRPNMGALSGFLIAYFGTTGNDRGWYVSTGTANAGINFVMYDNAAGNVSTFYSFEDSVGSFIIQNEGGVMNIYDENNNIVGTTATTSIGAINYAAVSKLALGRRIGAAGLYYRGEWENIGFYNQALSSAQRLNVFNNIKLNEVNEQNTLTRYLFPLLNGSINPSAGDTMQCFTGEVLEHDGEQHLFYSGNNATGDIDTGFKATRPIGSTIEPFTKLLDGGLPKVILAPSGSGWDKTEVFIRNVFWDVDHAKMYYTGKNLGASPEFTFGLATSTDLETWGDRQQVYTDGTIDIIHMTVCKVGEGDYRAIANASTEGGETNSFTYDYATSPDGIVWTKQFNINSLFKNIVLVWNLYKINGELFALCSSLDRDTNLAATENIIIYKIADDFLSSVYMGVLYTKHEPSERATNHTCIVPHADHIELFYTYIKNANKFSADGGEGFSAIGRAVLNKPYLTQPIQVFQYPSWVKKYWPLAEESAISNTFYEYIDQQTTTFAGRKQWSIDGLNFFDFLGTGFSFPPIDLTGYTNDISMKMRVEIVTTGTINLFSIGTDIQVDLVSGKLRVRLNNATKSYITNADIAKPTGITDTGNHVYVGFIFQSGVLKLCVGNTIDIASTKTVDGAMTDILNGGANVLLCDGSTIEARSFVLMSGQTDQQWLDTDL